MVLKKNNELTDVVIIIENEPEAILKEDFNERKTLEL